MDFKKITLSVAVLMACSTSVFAGDMYVVGSVGRSTVDINKANLDNALADAGLGGISSTLDKDDTGYKLMFGYKFNQNFALEGGYVDLGKSTYDVSVTVPAAATAKFEAEVSGWVVSALGIMPLNDKFSVFAKLGTIYNEVKENGTVTAGGTTYTANTSGRSWKATYGVGTQYEFDKNWGVRAEYERFDKLGDKSDTGEADVDLLSIGVAYKF